MGQAYYISDNVVNGGKGHEEGFEGCSNLPCF